MWRNPKYKRELFYVLQNYDEIIIYDLETSGLSPEKDRIIQFAAIKYKVVNKLFLEPIDQCNIYINPGFFISDKITEITKITNELLFDKPHEDEAFKQIKDFLGKNFCICGYNNTKFDNKMMVELYKRYGEEFSPTISLDLFIMSRDIISKNTVDNYKLSYLVELYGLDKGLQFHNALDDVKATGELLNVFIYEYQENPNLLIKDTVGKPIPKIFSISYWQGPNHNLNRVYVSTSMGKIYYSIKYKYWENKDSNNDTINKINMERLEEQILKITGIDKPENLQQFKKIGYMKLY